MTVPRSRPGVRNKLLAAPDDVQQYFAPSATLIEEYPWEVSLSYMFARLERAHLMALYCGVVKLHKVHKDLARRAINQFENRHAEYQDLYKEVFGHKVPQPLVGLLRSAQTVRNNVVHGKEVGQSDYRKAISAIIDYATEFNTECFNHGGFRPFGSLQGFKGAAGSHDKSTSRLILRGVGLLIPVTLRRS